MLKVVRRRPVTSGFVALLIGLHAVVEVSRTVYPERASDVLREFGTVQTLFMPGSPDLRGQFDLWDGQWPRVFVNGFLHGGLTSSAGFARLLAWLHLTINCSAIALFGAAVEPRMRRWAYAGFLLFSASVAVLPEFLLGRDPVGADGAVFALFGALMACESDAAAWESDPPAWLQPVGWGWMGLCLLLSVTGGVNIAGVALLVGFGWGWCVGRLFLHPAGTAVASKYRDAGVDGLHLVEKEHARRRRRRLVQTAFLLASALFIPAAVVPAMRPFWNGRYHWYLADLESDPSQRLRRLEDALEWNPGLPGAWTAAADAYRERGATLEAWETILRGLDKNRSSQKLIDAAGVVWAELDSTGRRAAALEMVSTVFAEEDFSWRRRLGILSEDGAPPIAELAAREDGPREPPAEERFPLDQQIDLPATFDGGSETPVRDLTPPGVDPKHPDSAREGVNL